MNWIDFLILFVLILAFLNGFRRGVFKELSTFLGLICSIVFAVINADWLAGQIHGKINFSPTILFLFSFIMVLGFSIAFLKLLGHFYYKLVKLQPLKVPNKIGGGAFGILKGVLVLSLVFLLFLFPTPFRSIDNPVENSVMAKPIRAVVPLVYNNLSVLHPRSGDFISEIHKGIYLDGATLAMNTSDSTTVARLDQYKQAQKATAETKQ
jgi:membrane protein required for colicin V production